MLKRAPTGKFFYYILSQYVERKINLQTEFKVTLCYFKFYALLFALRICLISTLNSKVYFNRKVKRLVNKQVPVFNECYVIFKSIALMIFFNILMICKKKLLHHFKIVSKRPIGSILCHIIYYSPIKVSLLSDQYKFANKRDKNINKSLLLSGNANLPTYQIKS